MNDPRQSETLVDLLVARTDLDPGHRLYTFLEDGEEVEQTLDLAELHARAKAIAARLRESTSPGEPVLLIYHSDLDFVCGFFGCLYAGAVAVPAYPPRFHRSLPDQNLSRLDAIVRDCAPTTLLTTSAIRERMEAALDRLPWLARLHAIATDGLRGEGEAGGDGWRRPPIGAEDLAFIQYTSGSTGEPKGVMVSHGNAIRNSAQIERIFRLSSSTTLVGWVPLHHDMGLIGVLMQPLFNGGDSVFLSPLHFLQRPMRWLRAVTRYGANVSPAPDFGYRMCLDQVRPDDLEALDLSTWHSVLNGAEPVRARTLEAFSTTFAPCGFEPRFHYPCYGLAEATVMVTGGHADVPPRVLRLSASDLESDRVVPADEGSEDARVLVGSGSPPDDLEVAIVDPETGRRCEPDRIGEIWVAGPNVSRGYWGKDEENELLFRARTDDGGGPFLRTGDLGFLWDGSLFVTGRSKDLIILDGRNHYPQDIEQTVDGCHPLFRPGECAAFAMDLDGVERLVVVQELERRVREIDADEAGAAVRRAVGAAHDVTPAEVVFLRAGGLPKTSSGKVQRRRCRQSLARGELQVVDRVSYLEGER